jgi:hypothetical protein
MNEDFFKRKIPPDIAGRSIYTFYEEMTGTGVRIKKNTTEHTKNGYIAMKFRQLVFFYLITLAGLLWATFLLVDSDWFLPGLGLVSLIIAINIIILILWLRS